MSDAPEVYQAVPQGSPGQVPHTGPYYGGPRPEAEGLQVHSAYAENYNKAAAPYSDNPQQPYGTPAPQYGSPPLPYGTPPAPYGGPPVQQYGTPQQEYVNPPLGHQTQYAENNPGGFVQAVPSGGVPPLDEKRGKKRICGLSVLVFWGLVIAAFLIIVAAVVGGVVGSAKAKDSGDASNSAGGDTDGSSSSVSVTPSATHTTATGTGTGTATTTPSATSTSRFDEDTFYRLSNQYLGKGYSLDIERDNGTLSRQLNMSTSGTNTRNEGQYWQIKAVPDTDEFYWFACLFLGSKLRLVVNPSDRINPLMEEADDTATGQQWRLRSELDGTWRISNALGNTDTKLSTYSDTHGLFMDTDDDTGTEWSIAEVRKIAKSDGAW
ncbi:hypothetical protein V497_03593 [Pseudogymnoascus sp. VKM F-4516 (FW-969)]|nr:hypothetical protein V497_03593 [Pseudogymnoascus sp. VKM F-4516 (FW-969)]